MTLHINRKRIRVLVTSAFLLKDFKMKNILLAFAIFAITAAAVAENLSPRGLTEAKKIAESKNRFKFCSKIIIIIYFQSSAKGLFGE